MSSTRINLAQFPYRFLRMAGRPRTDGRHDRGRVYHIVGAGLSRALCSATPARGSAGWDAEPGADVTCRKCRARFGRVVRRLARVVETALVASGAVRTIVDAVAPRPPARDDAASDRARGRRSSRKGRDAC